MYQTFLCDARGVVQSKAKKLVENRHSPNSACAWGSHKLLKGSECQVEIRFGRHDDNPKRSQMYTTISATEPRIVVLN